MPSNRLSPTGSIRILSLLVAGLLPASVQPVACGQPAPTDQANGRIIQSPANIRSFRPDGDADAPKDWIIDPGAINLAAVYEHLGEETVLWFQHVMTLSNPFFEGRAPGTRGDELATEYIEFYFRRYGLEPAFPVQVDVPGGATAAAASSYSQPFEFSNPSPTVELVHASMSLSGRELAYDEEYVVLGNTGNGSCTGPITFVGYGIDEGQDGYSSFDEETDLTGTIALLLRYEPLDEEGHSRWSERRFSPQAGLARKIRAVKQRNPAGIILVNPPGAADGRTGLESMRSSSRFGRSPEVPVVQLDPEVADELLRAADPEGRSLATWRALADEGEVTTVALGSSVPVALSVEVKADRVLGTDNLGAVLQGRGGLADQWIVIGGHYDHLGYGYTGTRSGNAGQLHPGADDNASGTAGVLLLAKRLSEHYAEAEGEADLRSVLFMAFAAEEAGLQGSRHYVSNPTVSPDDMTAMINMDMIGRLRNDTLSIGGTGTASEFDELLRPIFLESGLTVSESRGGRGPSDHSSFFGAGVPVLFLFTGIHGDYHTPGDRGHTVNPTGAMKIVDLAEDVAMTLVSHPDRLTFVDDAGSATRGRRTGARVRLGIMPAYNAELETGVLVEEVFDGTSAAEAGVKAGDILMQWNDTELTEGAVLMRMLREHKPGDVVQLLVFRDKEELSLQMVLQAREDG